MGKCFRVDDLDQSLLLPPSLHDWLPEKHLARFVGEVVQNLNLSAFYRSYNEKDGRGQAAYHPVMMVRLLLYGYCVGVFSSRLMERRTYEDVAFRYLSADEHPDHSTISEFRQRHLSALAELFQQALQLCQKAGLVKLGHVAIDGKRLRGSRHETSPGIHLLSAFSTKLQATVGTLVVPPDSAEAVEAMRAFWKERLARLAEVLGDLRRVQLQLHDSELRPQDAQAASIRFLTQ